MSEFSIKILGSSSALPTKNRSLSAHVLNAHGRFYLIDCGEATQFQLRKFRVPMTRINQIFISHLHGDHYFGLFGLISTLNLMGKSNDLTIFAHSDLEHLLLPHLLYYNNKLNFKVNFFPLKPTKAELIFEDKGITVETIPLKHRIPTCGFLFREKSSLRSMKKEMIDFYNIPFYKINGIKNGEDFLMDDGTVIANKILSNDPPEPRTYAYCSDTAYTEKILEQIRGIDLLYHEATFLDRDVKLAQKTKHSTARQAAEIAKKAEVKKLLIGHFSSRYSTIEELLYEARNVFPDTELVADGENFSLLRR